MNKKTPLSFESRDSDLAVFFVLFYLLSMKYPISNLRAYAAILK